MTMISKDGEISEFHEYRSSGEDEASDKGVDSDLMSIASSKPMWKKTTKADPDRASRNCP
ncbi:hypothetical protein Tco_0555083, partial [Tanacetum coccineum]